MTAIANPPKIAHRASYGHARLGRNNAYGPDSRRSSERVIDREKASKDLLGQCYVPPGWPEQVPPPAVEDWEQAAVSWLLDCCPADYRSYPVLRRHPVVLARFAAEFVEGQIRSTRSALGEARPSLFDQVEPRVLDSAVDMLQAEEARLVRRRRAVALVEEALRGKVFIRKL